MKLHLGCGNNIKAGYVNVDIAELPGVDMVADLSKLPWPFENNSCEVIEMHNILEHLPDVFKTLQEIYRISAPNCQVIITVPYYNSLDYGGDPTHLHPFTQFSFDFTDERTPAGKDRPYYSTARFRKEFVDYYTTLTFGKYLRVRNPIGKKILGGMAFFLCNVIRAMTFTLRAEK